jgi:hypothetical protein
LQEYGADAADLSALWFDADEPCDGDDVLFSHGYSQIAEAVAQGLHDVIRLQHNVTRICYSNSSKCGCSCSSKQSSSGMCCSAQACNGSSYSSCGEVASNASAGPSSGCCCTCSHSNGSHSNSNVTVHAETPSGSATFHTRHAIVTFPIGVLKARSSSLFEPPLPAEKQAAIANLGVGLLDKVRHAACKALGGHVVQYSVGD